MYIYIYQYKYHRVTTEACFCALPHFHGSMVRCLFGLAFKKNLVPGPCRCLWSILRPFKCVLGCPRKLGSMVSTMVTSYNLPLTSHLQASWDIQVVQSSYPLICYLYIPCWRYKNSQNGMSEMELPNLSISSLFKINIILLGHMLSSLKPSRFHQSKWWNVKT